MGVSFIGGSSVCAMITVVAMPVSCQQHKVCFITSISFLVCVPSTKQVVNIVLQKKGAKDAKQNSNQKTYVREMQTNWCFESFNLEVRSPRCSKNKMTDQLVLYPATDSKSIATGG